MLTVIIPAYNEAQSIEGTVAEIKRVLDENSIVYELLIINDGSHDTTWNKVCELSKNDDSVRGVSFSKNYGKEAAIFAGLEYSRGACVAVIDADLQHPPSKLVEMYRLWKEGYEIVEGKKRIRGEENAFYTLSSRFFYYLMSKTTGIDMRRASDFKLLDRRVVNELLSMTERNMFFRAISSCVGFEKTSVEFDVGVRANGKSSWSTISLMKYALCNIAGFTNTPIYLIAIMGAILMVFSVIMGAITIVQKAMGISAPGFTTINILILFTGSMVMLSLGIIGFYISVIYEEVKKRPRFIVTETIDRNRELRNS